MKRTHLLLVLIFVVSLALRIHRVGSFVTFPESDIFHYLNCYNVFLDEGVVIGAHPGFTSFIGTAGVVSNAAMEPLFRYIGPLLGAMIVIVVYVAAANLFNERVGVSAAFIWGVTPLAIVRGGQTIAETLALSLLVLYLYLLYDAITSPSWRSFLLVPLFIGMFYIHNLTGAVAMLLTFVGGMALCALERRWVVLLALSGGFVIFLAVIYYVPPESLPQFKESYARLYHAIKEYVGTRVYGHPLTLNQSVWDMLFPTALIAFVGIAYSFIRRVRTGIYICFIALAVLFMTQAYHFDFFFLPHRFMIYLVIPVALLSGIVLAYVHSHDTTFSFYQLGIVVACCLLLVHAVAFPFEFNFLLEDEDFSSLRWGREHLEGHMLTYSKINNTQNKYTALTGEDVSFRNELFATNNVDGALLEVVASSFDMPIVASVSDDVTTYGVDVPKGSDAIDLGGHDRTLTSLSIAETFWTAPAYVVICDAIDWEQGVAWGKDYHMPVILYSGEHRGTILNKLQAWGSVAIISVKSDKLISALYHVGIEYQFEPSTTLHVAKREGALMYTDFNVGPLVAAVDNYLYVSSEVVKDYKDINSFLDKTNLSKIYAMRTTSYYLS
jgi:hypothetical protein